jgi:hypothetical protein
MAQATTISLSQFTAAVQTAVKAALLKHPKFKMDMPNAVAVSYLIRGIPVVDNIMANVTIGETQAFANEIAGHLGGAQSPAAAGEKLAAPQGVFYFNGRHVIVGIPAVDLVLLEK